MLVIFSCPASANITMFGDVAIQLLKLMGRSGNVPGALRAEDVPAALASLQAALDADNQSEGQDATPDEENDEPAVSLAHRAVPLIELLNSAVSEQCYVMWESLN